MKELLLKLVLPFAIIIASFWFMLWISFSLEHQNTKANADHLRKLGFEVITEENKCHAKIKDGSWRTCRRVLFVMGG